MGQRKAVSGKRQTRFGIRQITDLFSAQVVSRAFRAAWRIFENCAARALNSNRRFKRSDIRLRLGEAKPDEICYNRLMNREDIIARLRENEAALRARGVAHAALFGSRARGQERIGSDTDIMIEFAADACVTVYDYVAVKNYIATLFDGPVDVVDREGLKPAVRPPAVADAIYAF